MAGSGFARKTSLAQWNRFAHLPRWAAALIIALLIGLIAYGTVEKTGDSHVKVANDTAMRANGLVGDHALYSEIVRRVKAGEPYYAVATSEQRDNGYPTQPFLTVRLPTYAYIMAALGEKGTQALAIALALITCGLWYLRLRYEQIAPRYAHAAVLVVVLNAIPPLVSRSWLYIHESLTGTMIALTLALYRSDRIWPAYIAMAATLALRETALPLAMIFGLLALWDRNWKAAGAWMAMGLIYLAIIYAHHLAILPHILPNDLRSPGWSAGGGWLVYTSFLFKTSIFHDWQGWTGAVLIPLSLLGWASWKHRLGSAGFLAHAFYAVIFMAAARPDNFYWGLLVVPTLFIGLFLAPGALVGLGQSLLRKRA